MASEDPRSPTVVVKPGIKSRTRPGRSSEFLGAFAGYGLVEGVEGGSSPMLFQIEINEEEVLSSLQNYDHRITAQMLRDHVLSRKDLVLALAQWGAGDTEVDGRCADALSQGLIGLPWPTYGSSPKDKDTHDAKWEQAMAGVAATG